MNSITQILFIAFYILQAIKCIPAQDLQMAAEKEKPVSYVIISEDIEATPVLIAITGNADIQNADTNDGQTESGVNTPIIEVNATDVHSTELSEFCKLETNVDNCDAVETTETDETANTETNDVETEAQSFDTTTMAPALTLKPLEKQCTAVGNFPHESDCHLYYTCTLTAAEGEFNLLEQSCPSKTAFNMDYGRCLRDSFYCADGIACDQEGTFADAQSNTSYYWCLGRYIGGFHKYHIQCATGQVFLPELGRCFVDVNDLQNLPPNFNMNSGELEDEKAVKAELKQIKTDAKVQMKQQKLKEKLEKQLQKELAKKAIKNAKKEAKIKSSSKEDENYVCVQEGSFASALNSSHYYSCTSKKGKFKAMSMKCPTGHNFDQKSSTCILINATNDLGDDVKL